MKPLPDKIEDCIGHKLALKETVEAHAKIVFGKGHYILDISKDEILLAKLSKNELVRLFPEHEYPNGMVHALATLIGYEGLKEIFQDITNA